MRRDADSLGFPIRRFRYPQRAFDRWIAAHGNWWPQRENVTVWGRFALQACCGRHAFARRNQAHRYFGETLVARDYEKKGYVCWTLLRLFRMPGRIAHGTSGLQTSLVEARLRGSTGVVPQTEYLKRYETGLRLKNPDVVGYHFGANRWVFAEVKREHDRLHPQQAEALRFLREVLPHDRVEVCVADVRAREPGGQRTERARVATLNG